jgi:DNA-directed RNA polymerase subunit RPC12/RpoP
MPDPIGVKSICWRCEGEFIFTEDNLKQANPRCSKCSKKVDLYEVTPYFDEWQEYRIRTQNFIEYEEFEVIRAKGLDRQPLNKPAIRPAPDEVEVIEPDEPAPIVLTTVIEDEGEHAPDCDSFFGRECNCRV